MSEDKDNANWILVAGIALIFLSAGLFLGHNIGFKKGYDSGFNEGYENGTEVGFAQGVNQTKRDFRRLWSEENATFVFFAQNLVDEKGVWHKVGMTFPSRGLSFACGINRESSWQIGNFTTKYNVTRCSMSNQDIRDAWGDENYEPEFNLEAGRRKVNQSNTTKS